MTERMHIHDYFKKNKGAKPSKYGNDKIVLDGITFDSKAEAQRYGELKILKKAGQIKDFNMQPSFRLHSGVRYYPDFIVWGNDGSVWVEDVKGLETQVFKDKKKLFEADYPYLALHIIKY